MYLAGVSKPTVPLAAPTALGRALTLRCPACGGGGLFRRWLLLQPACPHCGLATDRGTPDHFVGAYLVNLIVAELLFATAFGAWVLLVWPDVPWDRIELVLVGAMLLAPVLLYPFTRTIWLAADLILDPRRNANG
jgi:uncharacterized protein (DUF983 family)